MNKQELADNILNIDFKPINASSIFVELEDIEDKFCYGMINEFQETIKSKKKVKEKDIKEIQKILNLKDSDVSQDKIKIRSTGKIHKIEFLSDIDKERKTLFIKDNIIVQDKHFNISFYPYQEGIITDYDPESYDLNNNHTKLDLKLKISNSEEYKKINHIIFTLKHYTHLYRDNFFEYVLNKIYAYIILNETKIEELLLNELFHIKEILNQKMHLHNEPQKGELKELSNYLNFKNKNCIICQNMKNPDYKTIYQDNLLTVDFSEKNFDIKIIPKNHIDHFKDMHYEYYSHLSKIAYFINKALQESNLIKKSFLITQDNSKNKEKNHIYIELKIEFIKNTFEIKKEFLKFLNKTNFYSFIESQK